MNANPSNSNHHSLAVEVASELDLPHQRFSPIIESVFDYVLAAILFLELIFLDFSIDTKGH